MKEEAIEYFDKYEESLAQELLRICTSLGMLDGVMLESEDINQKWKEFAPEYIAEALPEINTYPEVSLAWAGYLGMAIAEFWDTDWSGHHNDKYTELHGSRGFDNMDDHIMVDILGHDLESKEAQSLTLMLQTCAQHCITKIHHEQVEHQTTKAFHIYARTVRTMFRIGESLQLKKKGYKFEKLTPDQYLS